jgi:uncharacterized protein
MLALMASAALWAFVIEPNQLVVRRERLVLPVGHPLRMALLSDLHAGARFVDAAKVRAVVDGLDAEHPDVILLLGDYLHDGPKEGGRSKGGASTPEAVAAELARLRAPLGVYAVLGNHDWWFDGARITAALSGAGITVLENSAAELRPGLWIAGLADARTRHSDPVQALAGVPADATVLAMTHNPDVFPRVPARVVLTVAGHTHGGQVRLPLLGAPVVPSHYGQRFAAGHIVEDGRHLFVTSGVGTSTFPVRFAVPPEIVVLTLNPPR